MSIPIWPSPPQSGITDYASDDDATLDALQRLLLDLRYVGGDSRYSCGDDRRGYASRIARVQRMIAQRTP